MAKSFDSWTAAWFIACMAFAAHIYDEALHGTFGFYSDLERMMVNVMPSIQVMPFNFHVWLFNLTGTMVVLFALTPLVRAHHVLMVPASYLFATFLTANASMHLILAMLRQQAVTGSITAPIMLVAGLLLFVSTTRQMRPTGPKQG